MLARTGLVLTFAVVSLTAAACGLKGPLYRTDEPQRGSVSPTNSTDTTKKKDNTGSTSPGEPSQPPVAPPDPDRPGVPPNTVPPKH
jgi:predicted small lipoprotein YifL